MTRSASRQWRIQAEKDNQVCAGTAAWENPLLSPFKITTLHRTSMPELERDNRCAWRQLCAQQGRVLGVRVPPSLPAARTTVNASHWKSGNLHIRVSLTSPAA